MKRKSWRTMKNTGEIEGLGIAADRFKTMKEKYGAWPMTVWDLNNTDPAMLAMKSDISDGFAGDEGRKKLLKTGYFTLNGKSTNFESVFNPLLTIQILKMYAPETGVVYDPFAGGGTRAIVTGKSGLEYIGVEIREEEVNNVKRRLENNKTTATIINGDSCSETLDIADNMADFCLTCPPYYNLEEYGGGESDISMSPTYQDFLDKITICIKNTRRILKPGAISCWIVGIFRDKKTSELIPFHHDVTWLHNQIGFFFKEEVILRSTNQGAEKRCGMFEKGQHHLVRIHEYLLIFINQK